MSLQSEFDRLSVTRDEEIDLIRKAQGKDLRASKMAIERLITAYNPLIMSIVRHRIKSNVSHRSEDRIQDLIQTCQLGFLVAIQKFRIDETGVSPARLGHVARLWIRHHIQKDRVSTINGSKLSSNVSPVVSKINEVAVELDINLSTLNTHSMHRLAVYFGVGEHVIMQALRYLGVVKDSSLNVPLHADDSDEDVINSLPDPNGITEDDHIREMDATKICGVILDIMERLPERTRDIMKSRIFNDGDGQRLATIADRYGISKERARQIYERGMGEVLDALVLEAPQLFPNPQRLAEAREAMISRRGPLIAAEVSSDTIKRLIDGLMPGRGLMALERA